MTAPGRHIRLCSVLGENVTGEFTVEVYDDSVSADSSQYVKLQTQLDYLYPAAATATGSDGHVPFQVRQKRTDDERGLCGVANALATSMGRQPEQTLMDQAKMKKRLKECLKQRFFSLFSHRRSSPRFYSQICLFINR